MNRDESNISRIIPSALVEIHAANGNSSLARIAFDLMCQDIFIRESVVQKMHMTYDINLEIKVNGFARKCQVLEQGELLSVYPK